MEKSVNSESGPKFSKESEAGGLQDQDQPGKYNEKLP